MVERVADGLWRWAARHPEWHPPTPFGAEVASWLAHEGGGTVLVDPLLRPGDPARPPAASDEGPDAAAERLLVALDPLVRGPVLVVITIPYHTRDAAAAARRWDATVIGHEAVARRLPPGVPFEAVSPGDDVPLGLSVHRIGSPRRQEQPALLPERRALAFGDAVVGVEGGLRVWIERPIDDRVVQWYRERLVPSFAPLLELDAERVLVTHGRPVLTAGRKALAEALAAPPWYHRP
jgi:glyoxylase-like metal-dependent hydrolase (beta-lactamase superfamily II)